MNIWSSLELATVSARLPDHHMLGLWNTMVQAVPLADGFAWPVSLATHHRLLVYSAIFLTFHFNVG